MTMVCSKRTCPSILCRFLSPQLGRDFQLSLSFRLVAVRKSLLVLCNSMPLVRLGLTICVVMSSYFLVRHRIYKITLFFVWAAPVKA